MGLYHPRPIKFHGPTLAAVNWVPSTLSCNEHHVVKLWHLLDTAHQMIQFWGSSSCAFERNTWTRRKLSKLTRRGRRSQNPIGHLIPHSLNTWSSWRVSCWSCRTSLTITRRSSRKHRRHGSNTVLRTARSHPSAGMVPKRSVELGCEDVQNHEQPSRQNRWQGFIEVPGCGRWIADVQPNAATKQRSRCQGWPWRDSWRTEIPPWVPSNLLNVADRKATLIRIRNHIIMTYYKAAAHDTTAHKNGWTPCAIFERMDHYGAWTFRDRASKFRDRTSKPHLFDSSGWSSTFVQILNLTVSNYKSQLFCGHPLFFSHMDSLWSLGFFPWTIWWRRRPFRLPWPVEPSGRAWSSLVTGCNGSKPKGKHLNTRGNSRKGI